jgi:type II secretory pathway pseudopilin PulG
MKFQISHLRFEIARSRAQGFTYLALLAAIVIIGISLGSAGKYWKNVMLREKEEELLFRGNQYRYAIERYFYSPPAQQYPSSIDDLLTDNRTATGKRHLRQKFKDPMTGEDFEVFRDMTKGNRITGVYSKSEVEPLRQTGFSEENKAFEGKKTYKEWQFLFTPAQNQQQLQQQLQQQQQLLQQRSMQTPPPPMPRPF